MKTIVRLISLLAILLLSSTPCGAMSNYDAYNYVVPAGEKRTIAWDANPATEQVEGYEITINRMETGKTTGTWRTAKTQFTIIFKTIGHNFVTVKAYKTVNGVRQYQNGVSSSLDPADGRVDGKPRAWALIVPTTY